MSKVVKAATDGLKESEMFVEPKEKRMKFEERQKREERQFQLQMMQMLVGPAHPPSLTGVANLLLLLLVSG